jgi:hypothetical protein
MREMLSLTWSNAVANQGTAMEIVIRPATAADAGAVHKIVLLALRETNARDYPPSVIDRLVSTLPDKVASYLTIWRTFVAIVDGQVVGTGSLNGPDGERRLCPPRLSGTRHRHQERRHRPIAGDIERAILGDGKTVLHQARFQGRSGRGIR